jgi:hypothetical protein
MSNIEDELVAKWAQDKKSLFQPTESVVENTKPHEPGEGISSESIHNTLMAAGFTPGIGNIADATDALLYAFEGEFGNAALSSAAAIPIIGQYISSQKLLKAAQESGEEMITLYRGVPNWYPGKMVVDGKFVGGGKHLDPAGHALVGDLGDNTLYVTREWGIATEYATGGVKKSAMGRPPGIVLKFEVPKSYMDEFFEGINYRKKTIWPSGKETPVYNAGIFREGLPKDFLVKVHDKSKGRMPDDFLKGSL